MPTSQAPIRAAQYVRMSTEGQDFSIPQQEAAIGAFASVRGYEIVQTYADVGISGLRIERREGLKALLADVISGAANYQAVLIYDVSRWGRFQNPDQAAHYEFLCAEAGVLVEYCAEQFDNDGSITAALLKSVKRVMAAEYSRELSAKIIRAHEELAPRGYWLGGQPGYGLRRRVLRHDGRSGRLMEEGDRKGPQNGRTVLVRGPGEEVATVRKIFRLYLTGKLSGGAIARLLNREGRAYLGGKRWDKENVRRVLLDEKYVGVLNFRKSHKRLGARSSSTPRSEWLRIEGAVEPIISRADFRAAQRLREGRRRIYSDDEMLASLVRILESKGHLSGPMIDADTQSPPAHHYARRFGGIFEAYRRIGYTPTKSQIVSAGLLHRIRNIKPPQHGVHLMTETVAVATLKDILRQHGRLSFSLIDRLLGKGASHAIGRKFGGCRRMFALAGHVPTLVQQRGFDRNLIRPLSAFEAETLRLAQGVSS